MYKYPPVLCSRVVYHTTRTLAEAFGLSEKFVKVLVRKVDYGETKVVKNKILVPYVVFKRLKLPICRNWFHIVYSYTRERYLQNQYLRESVFRISEGEDFYGR